jgi:hypothetical protein
MRKLALFATVVGLVLWIGTFLHAGSSPSSNSPVTLMYPPANATPVDSTVASTSSYSYQFVGFSSGTTTGNAGGNRGLNALCQSSFGPSSRVCTSSEYVTSPIGTSISTYGWVLPSIVSMQYIPDYSAGTPWVYTDASGFMTAFSYPIDRIPNCVQYTSPSPSIVGLLAAGSLVYVTYDSCLNSHAVTCCAPASAPPGSGHAPMPH